MVKPGSISYAHRADVNAPGKARILKPEALNELEGYGVGAHSLAKDGLLRDIMKHSGLNPVRSRIRMIEETRCRLSRLRY
jgi:hypothetical protein